jgi:hypothetical protein
MGTGRGTPRGTVPKTPKIPKTPGKAVTRRNQQ